MSNDELFYLIDENIKNIRKNVVHKTQRAFAKEINKSRSFIAQIENKNKSKAVSLNTLFDICRTYNIDVRDFFKGCEKLAKKKTEKK